MYGTLPGVDGLPVAEYDKMKMRFGNRLDVAKMFGPAFTLACCFLFVVPTFMLIWICRNPVVSYFNGYLCYLLLVNPMIIAYVHNLHQKKQAPSKWGIIGALVIPSLLCLVAAEALVTHSTEMEQRLTSLDCITFNSKAALQVSWENGYSAFMNCVNQTGVASNVPNELIMQNFRLEDCSEYEGIIAQNKGTAWGYLQSLEEEQKCSGWCYPAQQLWATGPTKDSCATVVAAAFGFYVKPHAVTITSYMIGTLVVSGVLLGTMGPHIRRMGYEW